MDAKDLNRLKVVLGMMIFCGCHPQNLSAQQKS